MHFILISVKNKLTKSANGIVYVITPDLDHEVLYNTVKVKAVVESFINKAEKVS
jgi:hypothetical protein